MSKIRVAFRYERPKAAPGTAFEAQTVHRTQTESKVVDVVFASNEPDPTKAGYYAAPSESAIRSALAAAGVAASGPGGMSLVIEGYSIA